MLNQFVYVGDVFGASFLFSVKNMNMGHVKRGGGKAFSHWSSQGRVYLYSLHFNLKFQNKVYNVGENFRREPASQKPLIFHNI